MDKPSAQTQVHLSTTYRCVIKDIENLEQFYDAKVLAIGSTNVSKKRPAVSFVSKPTMPKQEQKPAYYKDGDTDFDGSDNWSFIQDVMTYVILPCPRPPAGQNTDAGYVGQTGLYDIQVGPTNFSARERQL